jgi:CheY-like chemotaxis protein
MDLNGRDKLTLSKNPRYETLLAHDGRGTLAICAADQPHLVFLDLMMPGTDGMTVWRELKNDPSTAPIKVIVLSAQAQLATIEEVEAAEADGFMSKPFRPSELRQRTDEIFGLAA